MDTIADTTRERFVTPVFLHLGTSNEQFSLTPDGLYVPGIARLSVAQPARPVFVRMPAALLGGGLVFAGGIGGAAGEIVGQAINEDEKPQERVPFFWQQVMIEGRDPGGTPMPAQQAPSCELLEPPKEHFGLSEESFEPTSRTITGKTFGELDRTLPGRPFEKLYLNAAQESKAKAKNRPQLLLRAGLFGSESGDSGHFVWHGVR